jgi:DNA-binding HxlR family transcriptional regulator
MKNTICLDSVKLLGDHWTLRIIDALKNGDELRYCQIQRDVAGINPVTLANRLKKLEQSKLIERQHETQDKLSVSYRLTSTGQHTLPVIEAINQFSHWWK